MARNFKKEYIQKLAKIKVNGFKADIPNYMLNPNFSHEYPNLKRLDKEDDIYKYYTVVLYFKHYNGNGKYIINKYTAKKDNTNEWLVVETTEEKHIETSNRFSMKRLQEIALYI